MKPFEVNKESTGISPEEPLFKTDDGQREIPEQEFWQRKAETRNIISSQHPILTIASYYHIDLPQEPSIVDMANFNKPSRKLIGFFSDSILLVLQREMAGRPFDDQVLFNFARYMLYSRNTKRVILKDDAPYRQHYNKVVHINHLQVLLSSRLLAALLKTLHGRASKQPGLSQMMHESRHKQYFPSKTKHVRKWLQQCETCVEDKRSKKLKLGPEIFNVPEWDMGREASKKIDLLPELSPSGSYKNIVKAIDIKPRYSFAYPVSTLLQ